MEDGSVDEELSDYEELRPASKKGKKATDKAAKGKGRANSEQASSKSQQGQQDDPMGASQRKIQNRVAQREFRQRKLQYVKDLEARVEFLSGSRDTQLEALKAMLRGVLEENKQLRTLLQQVSAFVGKGLGGHSHELGFQNVEDFEEFVNRHDRDTLHRIHEGWKTKYAKNNKVETSTSPSGSKDNQGQDTAQSMEGSQRRTASMTVQIPGDAAAAFPSPSTSASPITASLNSAEADAGGSKQAANGTVISNSRKRTREAKSTKDGEQDNSANNHNRPSSTSAMASTTSAINSFAMPVTTDLFATSNFGNNSSSSFFFDFGESSTALPSASSYADLFAAFDSNASFSITSPLDPTAFTWDTPTLPAFTTAQTISPSAGTSMQLNNSPGQALGQPQSTFAARLGSTLNTSPRDAGEPNPLLQAIQVISSHLRNKATNPLYELPKALQPTALQLSTPHDSRINSLPWAGMRDRLILNPEYDLNEVLPELLQSADLHSTEDILNPEYWEMSEQFCQRYRALVTPEALRASNYWRQLRGEPEIKL